MKKRVLFITASLGLGGSEKCMVEMIRHIDLNLYDITVLALIKTENMYKLDERISIINGYEGIDVLHFPLRIALRKSLYRFKVGYLFRKTKFWLESKIYKDHLSKYFWLNLSHFIAPYNVFFDTVIGYGQGVATYFCIDKVENVKRKILWVNTDLEKAKYDISYLKSYYKQADIVVADSMNGKKNLERLFSDCKDKVFCFSNMLNTEEILYKGRENDPGLLYDPQKISLLTVGRLVEAKALHLAVGAAKILKDRKIKFKWYIVGDGNLRGELEKQIYEMELENHVFLVGVKTNPYPWFAGCDIYVQTSIYEGSCMTIDEALVFEKPVITTDFPAAYEKIKNGINGLVCSMDSKSIAMSIETLIVDKKLADDMRTNIKNNKRSYGQEMKKLYEWIGFCY